jgi:signal recognition particle receptor subunit beta
MQHGDSRGNAVVVRLVYDGPPRSGKTTSLRALAGSLARPYLSWDEEDGRTLYFDWLEYVGGSFEGSPIRCQIVSVPGQRALAHRREELLRSADAVIFVANATDAGIAEATESLRSLQAFLGHLPAPRPGLILQANKRDQPDALPVDTLRSRLKSDGLAIVESVATEGTGIRETFIFAVRLALDRVRARLSSGVAVEAMRHADTPEQLLARLHAAGTDVPPEPPAAVFLREVLAGEDALRAAPPDSPARPGSTEPPPDAACPPRLPDREVPSGRVWPPVAGRLLLDEAPAEKPEPHQGPDGSWKLQLDSWFFHSAREHHFPHLDVGRQELLHWAGLHTGTVDRLAPRRCIVLAETGLGSWRLWQLVHHVPSLGQQLRAALAGATPEALAETLLTCAADLLTAREILTREPPLPCRLELLGRVPPALVYVGILPPPSWTPADGESAIDPPSLLRRELLPVLQRGVAGGRIDVPRVQSALAAAGIAGSLPGLLAALLQEAQPA